MKNGVHPRRIELIAQLLFSLAQTGDKQVIVTTHSPLEPFPLTAPLYDGDEITASRMRNEPRNGSVTAPACRHC
jgi:predicted ATPase